jgi:hypothetical protein
MMMIPPILYIFILWVVLGFAIYYGFFIHMNFYMYCTDMLLENIKTVATHGHWTRVLRLAWCFACAQVFLIMRVIQRRGVNIDPSSPSLWQGRPSFSSATRQRSCGVVPGCNLLIAALLYRSCCSFLNDVANEKNTLKNLDTMLY